MSSVASSTPPCPGKRTSEICGSRNSMFRPQLSFGERPWRWYLRWFAFCPSRLRVSKGSTRVNANNWRIICQCQRHRSGQRSLIEIRQLRGPVAALLITSSLVLLGATYPIEATNLSSIPLRWTLPNAGPMKAQMGALTFAPGPTAGPVSDLPLVTNRIKRDFLKRTADQGHLISERVKEEFFHTEVPFGAIIYQEARRHGLAPELVAAIVQTESDFRPTLLSSKNAHGLMQILPSTGELMGAKDLFNPAENVRAGTKYLSYLQNRFDHPDMVLAAYNAGEATVRKYGGIPPFPETQNFVRKVSRNHQRYQQQVAKRLSLADSLRIALPR